MTRNAEQDAAILRRIAAGGSKGIDPKALIDELGRTENDMAGVIEALQGAFERGEIMLSSDGMIVSLRPECEHAA